MLIKFIIAITTGIILFQYNPVSVHVPIDSYEQKLNDPINRERVLINKRMDHLIKYRIGVTINEVNDEFISLFNSRDECSQFLDEHKNCKGLARLTRVELNPYK